MSKLLITFFFVGATILVSAQNSNEKIKVENVTLKTANPKNESPKEKVINNQEENEPVIIQRLEYTAPGYSKNSSEESKTVNTMDAKVEPVVVRTIEDEIADVENYINAIDVKVNAIKNNPSEDKKAKESGWYDQMDGYKKNALEKKTALLNSKK